MGLLIGLIPHPVDWFWPPHCLSGHLGLMLRPLSHQQCLRRVFDKKRGAVAPRKKRTGAASVGFTKFGFQLIETCLRFFHLRFQF